MDKTLGLALSGGVAWGLAHIGVLEILEQENIRPRVIVGTSMGAIVGCLWLMGKSSKEIAEFAAALEKQKRKFIQPRLSRHSVLNNKGVAKQVQDICGQLIFADLPATFACVATDVHTGEEVVLRDGPLWPAILATSCLPILFEPVYLDGRYLIDGGFANNAPVSVCQQLGADRVIAVSVQPRQRSGRRETKPNMLTIGASIATTMSTRLTEQELSNADVVIEPDTSRFKIMEFAKHEELIDAGRRAAREMIKQIRIIMN